MSANRIAELYRRKEDAYKVCRGILDEAGDEALTPEQLQKYEAAEQDMDKCDDLIEREKRMDAEKKVFDALENRLDDSAGLQQPAPQSQVDTRTMLEKIRDMTEAGKSRKQIFTALSSEESDYASAFRNFLRTGDKAALQSDNDAGGGFLRASEQFVARLIQDLDNMVMIRQYATVLTLGNAESLGVPTLETDISDTNWTTELETGTADTSMEFGKRRLTPHPLAKKILVSKDLLGSAAVSVDALVRERMGYKFGTVQETAFMTGSGAGQPLGLFTASSDGISTSRDVSTDNTTSAFTADGLINAKYTLAGPYMQRPGLRWVFHRDAVKMARKLKDGEGQYLWQPGLRNDMTDTLLGVPVIQSEYAPNTFTTGLYVGLIGDLSYYWIADSMGMSIQRLVELGALTNQDYFIGRLKCDGMPVHENAFVRVTLA